MKANFKLTSAVKAGLNAVLQFNCRKTNYTPKLILISLILAVISSGLIAQDSGLWLTAGQNLNNTRNAPNEIKISPQTVSNLVLK